MANIETTQRHFIVDMDEREAVALVLALEKFNQVTSPAYKLRNDLVVKLGYTPADD